MEPSLILDPASVRALLQGRKTQLRLAAGHRLGLLAPGTHIYGREACAPGRRQAGRELLTDLPRAEFVVFADGWRRDREGNGWQGKPPLDPNEMWITAPHMPDWACRMVLQLQSTRTESLQEITPEDLRAEGLLPVLGGLLWRWPKPVPGLHLSARRAFAAHWNITHPVSGLCWDENPQVLVLDVTLAAQAFLPRSACLSSASAPSTSASRVRLRS